MLDGPGIVSSGTYTFLSLFGYYTLVPDGPGFVSSDTYMFLKLPHWRVVPDRPE